ncbi:uncharacterized protein STEHIDRAFT_159005 [Stereum hirsutum FP-91666 SS1]|uniref:uncharacterized protein n=1 Tax=Stereum hirsutum (strain FP-91666) TaxID=721885 RepID=UPI0004449A0C|nr:uncharacterized protein STEHIDRAFT_159005 [Stereum hirsutum FP-91666 SS1]EIM84322.1 hypothetical protein STEHIDRAFT_159005 [Stereum hirsutum FP-91666 SS1]
MSDTPETTMPASGSKRGRGRGGGRGRGARGAHTPARANTRIDAATSQEESGKSNSSAGEKARAASRDFSQKPSPTHFISLPIGHHEALRASISNFTSALLQSTPPITGFDKSIVISPRRLHLTLGVMSLAEDPGLSSEQEGAT